MRLFVDVGNTAVKLAVECGRGLKQIPESEIIWSDITQVVVAQVGHAQSLLPIATAAADYGIEVKQAEVSAQLGKVQCAYPQFQNLGIDRWLTVVASHYLYPNKDCVVIDSGTATKIDVVDCSGKHLGGWILPGLDMMVTSLVENTEKVFSDELSTFEQQLGVNTPNAVKNGALVSTLGAIQAGIERLSSKKNNTQVIFAGGYGELLQQHYHQSSIYIDDLVLRGLQNWCDFTH